MDAALIVDGIEYHVTAVRNGSLYGHAVKHCDESGCNGSEKYLGPVSLLAEVA